MDKLPVHRPYYDRLNKGKEQLPRFLVMAIPRTEQHTSSLLQPAVPHVISDDVLRFLGVSLHNLFHLHPVRMPTIVMVVLCPDQSLGIDLHLPKNRNTSPSQPAVHLYDAITAFQTYLLTSRT